MSTAKPPLSSLLVLALLSSLIALGLSAAPAQAAPGDPFDPATPTVFVSQDGRLFAATTDGSGTTNFTQVGPQINFRYNAIAYNPVDNYIYAISVDGGGTASDGSPIPQNALVRIGQDAYITRAGSATYPASVLGAFGADGYFYIYQNQGTEATIIDVTTGAVVDTLTLSEPILNDGADWSLKGGYFWSLGDGTIARVDPTTGSVTRFAVGSPDCGLSYGAAWTYGNGNLGFSCNTSGDVVQIAVADPSSASPTFTVVAVNDGPASSGNDGTAIAGLPADLEVVKDAPASFTRGDTISYTVTVTNNGAGDSSGFVVSDSFPDRLSNVASADPACTVAGNDVSCVSGVLAVGASQSFTITADAPTSGGCLTNEAAVLGNEADPDGANDTSSATSCPIRQFDLSLDKRAASGPRATVGDNIRYRIQITNRGPDGAPGPIRMTDRLPDGLELRSANGRNWSCKVERAKDKVTCRRTANLGVDRKAPRVTVVAKATKAAVGRIVNKACVKKSGDIRRSNNCDPARVRVVRVPPPPPTGFRTTY